MDPLPLGPRLLLAGLLLLSGCCGDVPSLYTIDAVGLSLLPGPTVPSGTTVTLSCSVSVSHDSALRLTHVFRFTRFDAVVHAVNSTAAEARHHLDPARAADSGDYECQVEVMEKVRHSLGQRLTVTGLQTPVFTLSAGVVYEGGELVASCSAPQEKGALVFQFFQRQAGGAASLLKHAISTGSRSETRLVLREAGDRDMFCNYSIPMAPQAGSSNNSNTVHVLVKVLPISPTMNVLPSTSVYEGDLVEVFCKVVAPPNQGVVDVYLTKDRKVLKRGAVVLNHRFTAGAGDAGEYVCKAEYEGSQKETYETIRVKELFSRPVLLLEPPEVFEEEIMRVSCVLDITSSERVVMEDVRFSVYKDQQLLVRGSSYSAVALRSQNGNYTCRAEAVSQGRAVVKESAALVVRAKVPVSAPVLSVVGGRLVVGRPFALRCHSDSGSFPITYTLHGPRRPAQTREVHWAGAGAVFNTSAVQRSADLLLFLCHAQNNKLSAAQTSADQELLQATEVIVPVSKPALTLVPNGASVSEGQDLTLVCSVQSGTLPVTFTWFHSDRKNPLAFQTLQGLAGAYTITAVARGHSGGYYCEGSNPAHEIKRSFIVVVGVQMAGWKKGMIAVACVLLLLAAVLAVLHKRGLLRRKGKTLSVKPASRHTERHSLTAAAESPPVNVTPGVMGRNVWSGHVSGSDTDEQNSVASPEEAEPQHTEVTTHQPDPSRGPDTVYSEVRNSKQGDPEEPADGGSVEYAQLNNDSGRNSGHRSSGHGNSGDLNNGLHGGGDLNNGLHGGGSVPPDSVDDIDELNNTECATEPEICGPGPDC